MAQPAFGITINEVTTGPLPAQVGDFSTLALVVTAPNANAATFPLNTPVLVNSQDDDKIADLGAGGSVESQFTLIDAHSGDNSCNVIVVVVEEGADEAGTLANLVAGVAVLEDAASILGIAPRLVGVPGFTHQQETSNSANVVVTALQSTLDKLEAVAVVTGPHSSLQAFTDWRETITSDRVIPVETWVKIGNPAVDVDSCGAALALLAMVDNENGGRPFKSAANRPMNIVAPNRDIPFSITDGATEGQLILSQNGGIIVRGAMGAPGAIADSGFVFIATDTAASEPTYRFYNVRRGRDYIHTAYLNTLRLFLGRRVINQGTIEDIKETMANFLRALEATGDILGFAISFDASLNPVAQLQQGSITITAAAEEAPVLVHITIDSERLPSAFEDLASKLQ